MAKSDIAIELTAAIVFDGRVRRAGDVIKCTNSQAKGFLERGRGKLATDFVADDDEEKSLSEHTVAELQAIADEYEIDGIGRMRKAELIEAIEAAEADDE